MKTFLCLIALCTTFLFSKVYASNPDDILRTWLYLNEKNEQVKIEVYKEGDRYYGKIIWLQVPNYTQEFLDENNHPEKDNPNIKVGGPKIDFKSPDANHRNDPIIGLVILRGVKYDDGEWNDGHVYKADEGKLYTCYAKLVEPDKLKLKGYILGMPFLGKTRYWARVKQ
jgi:uncharacterized protein (DUF2147 family)